MDVFQAIKKRYSCRSYKAEPVPEDKLKKILEAVRLAPSAHNSQEWKFIIVKNAKKRKELAEAANQSFIAKAPIIIVAVGLNPDDVLSSGIPDCIVNLAIAVDHMTLQATEEGLGTCWIGAFSQEKVKKVLGIPKKCKVAFLMPLGFPAEKGRPKTRKSLEEIISYDRF